MHIVFHDKYSIKYSPGIIFSGQVPAFDVDFITAEEESEKQGNKINNYDEYGTKSWSQETSHRKGSR